MNEALTRIEALDGALPAPSTQHAGPDGGALSSLAAQTDLSNCLLPLLTGIGWQGNPRHVAEAIPHFSDFLDITGFRNVLAHLDYRTRPVQVDMDEVDVRLMPCLFLPDEGAALVLLGYGKDGLRVFDGERGIYTEIPIKRVKGTAFFSTLIEKADLSPAQQARVSWFKTIIERFRGLIYQILGITLILNLLALATPMFVMAIYDKVVATGSMSTLFYFAIGVGIAIVFDAILRAIRSRILAFIGARLDNIIGNAVSKKFCTCRLRLPNARPLVRKWRVLRTSNRSATSLPDRWR